MCGSAAVRVGPRAAHCKDGRQKDAKRLTLLVSVRVARGAIKKSKAF
jgi:hypothetical protein